MTVESLAERLVGESHVLNQLAAYHFSQIRSRATYIRYLIQTYHYVVAAVPLMKFAMSMDYTGTDPIFREYLARHIEEESGHDRWIVNDLKELGVSEDVIAQHSPFPETCQLAGAAYYAIAHRHPVSILGYMHALESAPVTAEFLEGLAQQSGVPLTAMFTLSEHGVHDLEHRTELGAIIERYQGQESLEVAIRDTMLIALSSVMSILKGVNDLPSVNQQATAS